MILIIIFLKNLFQMAKIFKIWSCNRETKIFIILQDATIPEAILKCNEKMSIRGTKLVLERDGTLVDDDLLLQIFQHETLMVLEDGETWRKEDFQSTNNNNDKIEQPNVQNMIHEQMDFHDVSNGLEKQQDAPKNKHAIPLNAQANAGQVNNIPPGAIILPQNAGDIEDVAVINGNSELPGPIVNPWSTYEFNWNQVEQFIINRLATGDRTCRIRKLLVHRIILQMRDICIKIPIRVLRNVAKKIVETYSDSLEDRLRGKKYSKSFMTFLDALREHNNYLNRSEKQRPPSNSKKTPVHIARLMMLSRVGTVNWQPDAFPVGETEDTLKVKRNVLKDIFISLEVGEAASELKNLEILAGLQSTFKIQREFFNNFNEPPTTEDLWDMWPILLRREYLLHHYELLMGHSAILLQQNFLEEKERIFKYGHQANLTAVEEPEDYEVLKIIFSHFKEDTKHFLLDVPVSFR